jgi:hypothetical protein
MRRVFVQSLSLALLVVLAGCAGSYSETYTHTSVRSTGRQVVVVPSFYETLSPYGQWFEEAPYGWCWTPYDVSPDWRPYSDGYWEYTDYGWSWVSNEEWGGTPYHYGRWYFDDSYGWVWVPGDVWAPAWVAWRYGDDYVGWAPLPPGAGWDGSIGLTFTDANAIAVDKWCFVPRGRVLDRNLRPHLSVIARNGTLFKRSHDATRFEVRNGRPANVGLDVARVEGFVGRPVPRVKDADMGGPGRRGGPPAGKGGAGFDRPGAGLMPSVRPPAREVAGGRGAIPDDVLQRRRQEQQRKLESGLKVERARLARDQQDELRKLPPGARADEIRKQHASEEQAFEARAARQRQVLEKRVQKQIVKPGKVKSARPADKSDDAKEDDSSGK